MPTGYTAALHDGEQSFKEFATKCSEAFLGEGVTSRKSIEDFFTERLKSVLELLNNAKSELAKFRDMSPQEVLEYQKAQHEKESADFREWAAKKQVIKQRYEGMRNQVLLWVPPGPEYMNFKEFMMKQLEESINFDCSTKYDDDLRPKVLDPEDFRKKKLASLEYWAKYYQDQYEEGIRARDNKLKWFDGLVKSLEDE